MPPSAVGRGAGRGGGRPRPVVAYGGQVPALGKHGTTIAAPLEVSSWVIAIIADRGGLLLAALRLDRDRRGAGKIAVDRRRSGIAPAQRGLARGARLPRPRCRRSRQARLRHGPRSGSLYSPACWLPSLAIALWSRRRCFLAGPGRRRLGPVAPRFWRIRDCARRSPGNRYCAHGRRRVTACFAEPSRDFSAAASCRSQAAVDTRSNPRVAPNWATAKPTACRRSCPPVAVREVSSPPAGLVGAWRFSFSVAFSVRVIESRWSPCCPRPRRCALRARLPGWSSGGELSASDAREPSRRGPTASLLTAAHPRSRAARAVTALRAARSERSARPRTAPGRRDGRRLHGPRRDPYAPASPGDGAPPARAPLPGPRVRARGRRRALMIDLILLRVPAARGAGPAGVAPTASLRPDGGAAPPNRSAAEMASADLIGLEYLETSPGRVARSEAGDGRRPVSRRASFTAGSMRRWPRASAPGDLARRPR